MGRGEARSRHYRAGRCAAAPTAAPARGPTGTRPRAPDAAGGVTLLQRPGGPRVYLVTLWISWASLLTLPVLTPAMEMRPSRVM